MKKFVFMLSLLAGLCKLCQKGYDYIGPFKKGLAIVQNGSLTGMIDEQGKEVVKVKYDHIGKFNKNGLAMVNIGALCGMIDMQGNKVVKVKYDHVSISKRASCYANRSALMVLSMSRAMK